MPRAASHRVYPRVPPEAQPDRLSMVYQCTRTRSPPGRIRMFVRVHCYSMSEQSGESWVADFHIWGPGIRPNPSESDSLPNASESENHFSRVKMPIQTVNYRQKFPCGAARNPLESVRIRPNPTLYRICPNPEPPSQGERERVAQPCRGPRPEARGSRHAGTWRSRRRVNENKHSTDIGARLTLSVNAQTDARTWVVHSTSVECLFSNPRASAAAGAGCP